jgi:hypothetical protein
MEAKPLQTIFTGMLALSLVTLLAGCVLLYLDFNGYPLELPTIVLSLEH